MSNVPLLEVVDVSKHFKGIYALKNVNLQAYCGEAHGLLGVNGAGKSTLMNILAGVFPAEGGQIRIAGQETTIHSPIAAEKVGISLIHQETVLFRDLTVAENMFITSFPTKKGMPFINKKFIRQEASLYLQLLKSSINPDTRVENLSIGDRQMVEIAKALSKGSRIILFDEPTSSLSFKEKQRLFEVIRALKEQGTAIIYISHFLDEVREVCDRVTALRDGQVSGTGLIDEFTHKDLVRLVIGRSLEAADMKQQGTRGEVVLRVENLTSGKAPRNVNFELHRGEIVGLWGLMGSGRSETVRTLLGFTKWDSGTVRFLENGQLKTVSGDKLLAKSGYVTENRHEDGLFLSEPLWRNISAASLKNFITKGLPFMKKGEEKKASSGSVQRLNIACPGIEARADQLSGGNQQKVIMAKWTQRNPDVFFLDEPSRGVDVGAKREIHKLVRSMANEGAAVLVISSEIEELMQLSDRVLVLNRGSIVAEVTGDQITKDNLMSLSLAEEGAVS